MGEFEPFDLDDPANDCQKCGTRPQWPNPLAESEFCKWCTRRRGYADRVEVHYDTLVRLLGVELARAVVAIDPTDEEMRPTQWTSPADGSHLVDGEFQSDKYPTCPPGKVPLSVKDATAQDLLWIYAQRRREVDARFSADLEIALRSAEFTPEPTVTCGIHSVQGVPCDFPSLHGGLHSWVCPVCGEPRHQCAHQAPAFADIKRKSLVGRAGGWRHEDGDTEVHIRLRGNEDSVAATLLRWSKVVPKLKSAPKTMVGLIDMPG